MRRPIMRRNAKTLLLVISLAFNFGLCLAMAVQGDQPRQGSRYGAGKRSHERISRMLNLSPEQSRALTASRQQLFDELRTLKRRLHEESNVLAELLAARDLAPQAVWDQVAEVAAVRGQVQARMIQHILAIRQMLEPGQLEAFKGFVRRSLARSGRGRGRPHHGRRWAGSGAGAREKERGGR